MLKKKEKICSIAFHNIRYNKVGFAMFTALLQNFKWYKWTLLYVQKHSIEFKEMCSKIVENKIDC